MAETFPKVEIRWRKKKGRRRKKERKKKKKKKKKKKEAAANQHPQRYNKFTLYRLLSRSGQVTIISSTANRTQPSVPPLFISQNSTPVTETGSTATARTSVAACPLYDKPQASVLASLDCSILGYTSSLCSLVIEEAFRRSERPIVHDCFRVESRMETI